jgi:hypothetical protein
VSVGVLEEDRPGIGVFSRAELDRLTQPRRRADDEPVEIDPTLLADLVECPDCGEHFHPRGLGVHRSRVHA